MKMYLHTNMSQTERVRQLNIEFVCTNLQACMIKLMMTFKHKRLEKNRRKTSQSVIRLKQFFIETHNNTRHTSKCGASFDFFIPCTLTAKFSHEIQRFIYVMSVSS